MPNKDKLPRFMVADNPLSGSELYIIHARQPLCIIRAHDMVVIEGKADDGLLNRCKAWYISYLSFINH
jgi:hypothetical protein